MGPFQRSGMGPFQRLGNGALSTLGNGALSTLEKGPFQRSGKGPFEAPPSPPGRNPGYVPACTKCFCELASIQIRELISSEATLFEMKVITNHNVFGKEAAWHGWLLQDPRSPTSHDRSIDVWVAIVYFYHSWLRLWRC